MSRARDRRSFVSALASLAGLAIVKPSAQQPAPETTPQPPVRQLVQWDLTWLDQLKGRHKHVYDLGTYDLNVEGRFPNVPQNFLNAFRDVYKLEPPDVNVLIGIRHTAFPVNASDALWQKFNLGERWKIKEPATDKWAIRNIFLGQATERSGSTVRALQARGVVFWQCNNALSRVAGELARATNLPVQEVRADLLAGLNPGVKLVPAHTMALAIVQERGFTYEKL